MSLFKEKGDSRERCSFRATKLMEQPLKIVEGVLEMRTRAVLRLVWPFDGIVHN